MFRIVIITLDDPTVLVSPRYLEILKAIVYNLICLEYYTIVMLFSTTRIEFVFTVFLVLNGFYLNYLYFIHCIYKIKYIDIQM